MHRLQFRRVAVYACAEEKQLDFFSYLQSFLRKSHDLILVGYWNCILDARLDCVLLRRRRSGRKSLENRFNYFQLTGHQLDLLNVPA